ncbi:MAG TPA: M23 family metallopeptidase [Gemmatimonadales bacterium]|nr:M23 family metallopeptidase [Gemmatimonadales bacterium]
MIAAAGLIGAAWFWAAADAWPERRPLVAPPLVVSTAYDTWTDTVERNETLSDVLTAAGITGPDQAGFLAAARGIEPRRLRPGMVFHFRRVRGDSLTERVMVRPTPERRVWITRTDSGWVETVETIPWSVTRVRIGGRIASSLYEAIDGAVPDTLLPAAERVALAWAIADVYDWEVDFTRDVRPGDRFDVLLDRLESPEGERRFGRIWAARVEAGKRPAYAFYFEAEAGGGGFYDERGRSLRRAFLRAPLQFRRISSRFGGRFHPVLREWRAHQGVDYAAAPGTPVRATADGVVTMAGRHGGYGNLVELRHLNGIRTRYGHLSRFAPGIRVGARVGQNQTVGYVGSTGLSTGPHLHYEFLVNGRPTNPRRHDAGAGTPVPDALRAAFEARRAELQAQLQR